MFRPHGFLPRLRVAFFPTAITVRTPVLPLRLCKKLGTVLGLFSFSVTIFNTFAVVLEYRKMN
jgi:hypothetical protein